MKSFVMFLVLALSTSVTHAKPYSYKPINEFASAQEYKEYFDKTKAFVDQAESRIEASGFTTKNYSVKVSRTSMRGGCAFVQSGELYIYPVCVTSEEIESILINHFLN